MSRRGRTYWSEEDVAMLIQIVAHVDPEAPIMDTPSRVWTSVAKAAIYKAKATVEEAR